MINKKRCHTIVRDIIELWRLSFTGAKRLGNLTADSGQAGMTAQLKTLKQACLSADRFRVTNYYSTKTKNSS